MFSKKFLVLAAERAAKTAAQSVLLALGGASAAPSVAAGYLTDWKTLVGLALGGGVLSLLTSVASTAVGDPADPSLVKAPKA